MNTISNYCRFIGKMVNDPKLVEFDATSLCTFTLAINEYRREKNGEKKKTVNYFDFEAWDSGATTLAQLCKEGDVVDVVTAARNHNWTDPQGNKKFQTRFRVKEFKLFNNNYNDKRAVEKNSPVSVSNEKTLFSTKLSRNR